MTDTDIVIIGAGLAGLGAAARARQAGRRCLILEASDRVGGRAWTARPPQLGGVWFDMGAMWFHDAEHNPLADLAAAAGDRLLRSDEMRREVTFVDGRPATTSELADYAAAWTRFEAKTDAVLAAEGDVPLAEIARRLPDDPWATTVEAWEGPVICAADADRFSALDWRRNVLGGSNLVPDGGVGAFVERRLTGGLDIRLSTPVRTVRWGGRPIVLETDRGTVTAAACIVTASTGVLASGVLRFAPALPTATAEAVHALPMGMAIKVALRARGPDRLDLPFHASVDRRVSASGDVLMPFQCWPLERDYVQGWIGGSAAWALAAQGEAPCVDFALSHLRALFGGRVDGLFVGGASLVTRWDSDPWVRGAYCYATPGHAAARDVLARPLADGRLMLAGEACHVGLAGTLAGAWISGQRAADAAVAASVAGR